MNETNGINRAKFYQLALFPMNNGATNVYFVLILSYIATFGNKVLAIGMVFASFMVTGMRVFDAITDPIIGAIMDKTDGKFGKFRPFMVIGNVIMAISVIALYILTPLVPATMMWLRYTLFIILYAVWVIGYTFQTSVTRSAQPVLTNDPKQRPLFTVFNTIASLVGMGAMQFVGPIIAGNGIAGDYNRTWFAIMTPIGVIISIILTVLAIIGIWEKDQTKYFGIGGQQEQLKLREYVDIVKHNKPLQRLMVAGGGCKLALSIATNLTVLCMLYGCMTQFGTHIEMLPSATDPNMLVETVVSDNHYDNLYLIMMVMGYVFSAPFFLLTVRTSQKHGQKKSLMTYVAVAFASYIGVLVMLLLWKFGDPAWNLSIFEGTLFGPDFKITINLYTILFIIFFGIGYGAYYATADMPIPMVADCADYETYRSGKFIPGIMGTLFSLVDKLVSSLSATVVSVALLFIGVKDLPTKATPYVDGMNWVVIALFCLVPMLAWALTLFSMKGYSLDGQKIKTIQAVNAARKAAVANGMSMEEAMSTITDETVATAAEQTQEA
ncbi:MAG: MFS transporter [Clostridia bacterium]|nr:MFS transporter [Clostridia bacterium]